jgi:bacillolysin
MTKKIAGLLAGSCFLIALAVAVHPGGAAAPERDSVAGPAPGGSVMVAERSSLAAWNAFVEQGMTDGRLAARPMETEPSGAAHQRLDQYYAGLPVWGGQLIRHYGEGGGLSAINGRYYPGIQVNPSPLLAADQAVAAARADLQDSSYVLRRAPRLFVLPLESGYALTYQVRLGRRGSEMLFFVDAASGAILLRYDDLKTDSSVGWGTGVHGDTKKVSSDTYGAGYRTWDRLRPAAIKTYDFQWDYLTWYFYLYSDANLSFDSDNVWTFWSQNPVVDGHDNAAWTYDYYYAVHGRHGFNNADATIRVMVNFDISGVNNAFYDGYDRSLNFYDGDGTTYTYFTAGLDVVAHEYSHGVTDATSQLIYNKYSGALNEAFSDIMGACVEFYWQPAGTGFLHADWLCGEDTLKTFNVSKVFRRLDKPYLLKAWGSFPYPDHWTQRYTGSNDLGGVHVNATIATHWFYLLSEGGTNRVSGVIVPGIGLEEAEKIAYRTWVYYLFPSADFWDARAAATAAAGDLYGAGSFEQNAVKTAWLAVGIY